MTISDFSYTPVSLTVAPGAEVTWENADSTAHTATAEGDAFGTGSIQPGEQGSATAPDEPGEYPYICSFHPFMAGRSSWSEHDPVPSPPQFTGRA